MPGDPAAEIIRLRTALREFVALSTITATWVGREPAGIVAGLADLLVASLELDFAFVRLCDPSGGTVADVTRGHAWKEFPIWLQQRLAPSGQISQKEIVTEVNGVEGSCRGIVIPIGINGNLGLVAAACARTDFPTEIDQLLLSMSGNRAATAFQNAYLISELRSTQQALRDHEQELRKARDELEIKVAERTFELQRSEYALRRSEKELRDAIDSIPAMAWSARPDGSITYVNSRFIEYSGMSAEKSTGSGWYAAVHPEDLQRNTAKWRESVGTGEPFENEMRFRRAADGEYRWFLVRAAALRDEAGNILKWYGVLTDIEDRKRAEQLQADLAHVSRVTTLGELAASLAHEIKQPITAAATNAHTCVRWLDHVPPELLRARAAAVRAEKDGNRAMDIIDRLRALYKKAPPQREAVAINEVISEMTVLLRDEAIRYTVSIRTDLAADLPMVIADQVQLQQVMINLMLNGIEAMKNTGGVLTVSSQLSKDSQVLISVSDTGVGLPTETAQKIFDAFFTTKAQGSGMGLTISRSIVESHGGRLWATTNDGRGATFHFTLPIAIDAMQLATAGEQAGAPQATSP